MKGQTTIEPCAFCGEPSVEERVVIDSYEDSKGNWIERRTRWVCAKHAESFERDLGWKDRQARERRERSIAWRKAQQESVLFDGDEGAPPGMGRRAA